MSSQKEEIRLLTAAIEERLHWGSSQQWSNYDFEKLSAAIEDKTDVVLSVSTLRRIWGKVKTSHSPAITTLNCLTKFIDVEDWRSFQKQLFEQRAAETAPEQAATKTPEPAKSGKRLSPSLIIVALGALAVIIFSFGFFRLAAPFHDTYDPKDFTFAANKMRTKGLPNSVIFSYNATKAGSDEVFIAQNWDTSRKTRVPQSGTHHSSIYYYPGYFRAKLLIGDKIIKTHDIHIVTDGWLALAETAGQPIYFNAVNNADGVVTVDDRILEGNRIADPHTPLRLYYQIDMDSVISDNFTFETTIKNGSKNACALVNVIVHAIDHAIVVPVTPKPCIGDIRLTAFGKTVDSKYADLKGFGTELNEWSALKVVGKGQYFYFYVNGKLAYVLPYDIPPAGITGVQYRFNGPIAVKDTRFTSGGKVYDLK